MINIDSLAKFTMISQLICFTFHCHLICAFEICSRNVRTLAFKRLMVNLNSLLLVVYLSSH